MFSYLKGGFKIKAIKQFRDTLKYYEELERNNKEKKYRNNVYFKYLQESR